MLQQADADCLVDEIYQYYKAPCVRPNKLKAVLNFNIGHESLQLIQPTRINTRSMSNKGPFFVLVLYKQEDEAPEQRFICKNSCNSAHVGMVQTFGLQRRKIYICILLKTSL